MANLPPDLDTTPDDPAVGRDRSSAPGTPRWVLVLGIIAVVLIVAFVVQAVLGGGHGPGMHAPSSDAGGKAASSSPSGEAADVGGPADAAHAARTVEVTTLDTMAFEPSTIDVSASETVLTWRFGHAGTLEYACHEPGHHEAGMLGQLTVS